MVFHYKMNTFYEKYKGKRGFYFVASIPWIIYVIWLAFYMLKNGYLSYESNDDVFLNLISSGTFGHKYAMNVYNNIVFGWILTVLYSISPLHNWLTIIQYLFYFSGILLFGICNIYRNKVIKGYLTNFIIFWATIFTMVCNINYSKTSAFGFAVGLFIIGVSLESENYSRIEQRILQVIGAAYAIVGGLLRKETMYAVVPFAGVFALYFIIKYKKSSLKRLTPFLVVCALLGVAWIGNAIAYNADPDWKHFVEYNAVRTEVLDYGVPPYEENSEYYDSIGLSMVDVKMLSYWFYADEDVFSIEKLEKIVELRESNKKKIPFKDNVEEIGKSFVNMAGVHRSIYTCLFLFLALCICSSFYCFKFQLLSLLVGMGELIGFLLVNRTPERAIMVAVIVTSMMILFFSNKEGKNPREVIRVVCLILVGAYAYYGNSFLDIENYFANVSYDKTLADEFYNYIDNHEDELFVYDIGDEAYHLLNSYSPMDHPNEYMRTNTAVEGGWPIPSPVYLNIIEKYGDKHNLFKVLAENKKSFWLIAEAPEDQILTEYMRFHYGASPMIVDTIADKYYVVSFAGN